MLSHMLFCLKKKKENECNRHPKIARKQQRLQGTLQGAMSLEVGNFRGKKRKPQGNARLKPH